MNDILSALYYVSYPFHLFISNYVVYFMILQVLQVLAKVAKYRRKGRRPHQEPMNNYRLVTSKISRTIGAIITSAHAFLLQPGR